jgi:cell division protein FtsW (lipid II flippase)
VGLCNQHRDPRHTATVTRLRSDVYEGKIAYSFYDRKVTTKTSCRCSLPLSLSFLYHLPIPPLYICTLNNHLPTTSLYTTTTTTMQHLATISYRILTSPLLLLSLIFGTLIAYIVLTIIYRLTLHPLAKYPGPPLAKVTDIYLGKPSLRLFIFHLPPDIL